MALFRGKQDAGDRWAIVGLGNPGERYAANRHNAGAMVLEVLATRAGNSLKRHKSQCLAAEARLHGSRVVLARPLAYMNESGLPVGRLLRWYGIPPGRLVVVHDELDLPFRTVRVKVGGGTGGNNGLKSLVSHLGTPDFVRVRVGISRPRDGADPTDWVLSDFSAADRKELPDVLGRAADAAERIVEAGAERAMNEFNPRASAG